VRLGVVLSCRSLETNKLTSATQFRNATNVARHQGRKPAFVSHKESPKARSVQQSEEGEEEAKNLFFVFDIKKQPELALTL
jgi:hypothetical protein